MPIQTTITASNRRQARAAVPPTQFIATIATVDTVGEKITITLNAPSGPAELILSQSILNDLRAGKVFSGEQVSVSYHGGNFYGQELFPQANRMYLPLVTSNHIAPPVWNSLRQVGPNLVGSFNTVQGAARYQLWKRLDAESILSAVLFDDSVATNFTLPYDLGEPNDLLQNGGLESGQLDPFHTNSYLYTVQGATRYAGLRALRFYSPDGMFLDTQIIHQDVRVSGGSNYSYKARVKCTDAALTEPFAGHQLQALVSWYDTSGTLISTSTAWTRSLWLDPFDWTLLTGSVTAPSDAVRARIQIAILDFGTQPPDSIDLYFDEIQFIGAVTSAPSLYAVRAIDANNNASPFSVWLAPQRSSPFGPVNYAKPESYGAVGNGNTDDTAAWNEMVEYINTIGGGYVYLPPNRTYLLDASALTPFRDLTSFILEGSGSTLKTKAGNYASLASTLLFYICSNIRIQNLTLDGNRDNINKTQDFDVTITDNLETLSVSINGSGTPPTGGEIRTAYGSVPSRGVIFRVTGTGDTSDDKLAAAKGSAVAANDRFQVGKASGGAVVPDDVTYLPGTSTNDRFLWNCGIELHACQNVLIEHCAIHDQTMDCIYAGNNHNESDDTRTSDLTIRNCTLTEPLRDCIAFQAVKSAWVEQNVLQDSHTEDYLSIYDQFLFNCEPDQPIGENAESLNENIHITDNQFLHPGTVVRTVDGTHYALALPHAAMSFQRIFMSGNHFHLDASKQQNGIKLAGQGEFLIIGGNIFDKGEYAIVKTDDASVITDVQITDNQFSDQTVTTFYLKGKTGVEDTLRRWLIYDNLFVGSYKFVYANTGCQVPREIIFRNNLYQSLGTSLSEDDPIVEFAYCQLSNETFVRRPSPNYRVQFKSSVTLCNNVVLDGYLQFYDVALSQAFTNASEIDKSFGEAKVALAGDLGYPVEISATEPAAKYAGKLWLNISSP